MDVRGHDRGPAFGGCIDDVERGGGGGRPSVALLVSASAGWLFLVPLGPATAGFFARVTHSSVISVCWVGGGIEDSARNNHRVNQHGSDERKIFKARAGRTPGRVVRIGLGGGRCAYGRQLTGVSVEFYDRIGEPGEPVDLLEIVAAPVAFRIWVTSSAFRRRGGWELLDVVSLTQEEEAEVHEYAKHDPLSGGLTIYRVDPASGAGSERSATIEECQALERAAVWSPGHVEDRLRDHFEGRPNLWAESMRVRP